MLEAVLRADKPRKTRYLVSEIGAGGGGENNEHAEATCTLRIWIAFVLGIGGYMGMMTDLYFFERMQDR